MFKIPFHCPVQQFLNDFFRASLANRGQPATMPVETVTRAKQCRTRGQSNLTKSASRGAHSPVRGHPRGLKVVPLNSWGRVSY